MHVRYRSCSSYPYFMAHIGVPSEMPLSSTNVGVSINNKEGHPHSEAGHTGHTDLKSF